MDLQIALLLAQDGVVNGAVYALLALALVLVFSVTRVIFVPQGEFVAFGALSMAAIAGRPQPGTLWLLLALAVLASWSRHGARGAALAVDWRSTLVWAVALPALAACAGARRASRRRNGRRRSPRSCSSRRSGRCSTASRSGRWPTPPCSACSSSRSRCTACWWAWGSLLRRRGFAHAGVLRRAADLSGIVVTGQSLVVVGTTLVLSALLFAFFERTIVGKALRATAINRVGARLMGIPTALAGDLSFALAAMIGAVSGLLIAPLTTVYYDTGFLMG